MRNKDYQRVASFPMFKSGLAGRMGACCPSNNQIVPMPTTSGGLITISGQLVDEFGDIVNTGVHIWADQNQELGVIPDLDGKFILRNVSPNSIITFSHVSVITQIPANQVSGVITINTALQGNEVLITAEKKKDNTLKYVGFGLLAAIVLYGISKMGKDKKPVKASV